MNIGVYVSDFSHKEQMMGIANCLNGAIDTKRVTDASVFYDDICSNPVKLNCGLFNSTDVWNFDGHLIVTNLNSLVNAINIVNKINVYYYYGWEDKLKTLEILYAMSKGTKIICRNEQDAKYINRITGLPPIGISDNFENIIDLLEVAQNG